MKGNILYSIQVIIFTFSLMAYLFFVFKKNYPKVDRIECMGCSCIVSILISMVTTVLSMTYLEGIYYNAWVLFWFINFAMANCFARFEIGIVKFLQKKIDLISAE